MVLIKMAGLNPDKVGIKDVTEVPEIQDATLLHMSFPTPWCAICQDYVERFEKTEDPVKETITLIAHCHGSTSEVTVKLHERHLLTSKDAFWHPSHQRVKGRLRHREKSYKDRIPKLWVPESLKK